MFCRKLRIFWVKFCVQKTCPYKLLDISQLCIQSFSTSSTEHNLWATPFYQKSCSSSTTGVRINEKCLMGKLTKFMSNHDTWYDMVHALLMSWTFKLLSTRNAKIYKNFKLSLCCKILYSRYQWNLMWFHHKKINTSLVQVSGINDDFIHLLLKCRSVPSVNRYLTV